MQPYDDVLLQRIQLLVHQGIGRQYKDFDIDVVVDGA